MSKTLLSMYMPETLEIAQDALKTKALDIKTLMRNDDNQPLGILLSPNTKRTIKGCSDAIRWLVESYELVICDNCIHHKNGLLSGKAESFSTTYESYQDPWHKDIFVEENDDDHSITTLSKKKKEFRLQDTFYGLENEVRQAVLQLNLTEGGLDEYIKSMKDIKYHFMFILKENKHSRGDIQKTYLDFMQKTFDLIPENKKYAVQWLSGQPKVLFHLNTHTGSLLHGRPYLSPEGISNYGELWSSKYRYHEKIKK